MSYVVEKDWITAAGLRAVVTNSERSGHRCGYVGVPSNHPLHGVEYMNPTAALPPLSDDEEIGKRSLITALVVATSDNDDARQCPDAVFDVHGGLTYSGEGDYPVESDLWWFGYDCGHYGDGKSPEYLNAQRKRYPDSPFMWDDDGEFRSLEYCVSECESLATQIAEKTKKAA